MFEQELKKKINETPHGSPARNLLKVVLGEWQQKTATVAGTDEMGFNLVRKMVAGNDECLTYLAKEDPRHAKALEENVLLQQLLPAFLTIAQIEASLKQAGIDVKSIDTEAKAMGLAMKHFKANKLPVDGNIVKKAIQDLRSTPEGVS